MKFRLISSNQDEDVFWPQPSACLPGRSAVAGMAMHCMAAAPRAIQWGGYWAAVLPMGSWALPLQAPAAALEPTVMQMHQVRHFSAVACLFYGHYDV